MKNFLRNLTRRPNDSKIYFLVYVFFFISLAYGVAFVFFGDTSTVEASILFMQSKVSFPDLVVSAWGMFAMAVPVLNVANIGFRAYSPIPSMAGFLLWLYAAFIYAIGGFWFQLLVGALPNLMFWAWLYIRVYAVNAGNY